MTKRKRTQRIGAELALLMRTRYAEKSNRGKKYGKRDRKKNKKMVDC